MNLKINGTEINPGPFTTFTLLISAIACWVGYVASFIAFMTGNLGGFPLLVASITLDVLAKKVIRTL